MSDNKKLIEEAMSGLKLIKIKTNKKGIRETDKNIRKNIYKDVLDPLTKKAVGGSAKAEERSTDFGMLSVKYGVDHNPNPTHADRIAAATKGKKPKTADAGTGKFMVKGMGAAIRGGLTKGSS